MRAYWAIGMVMAAGLRAQATDCAVNVYVMAGAPAPAGMLGDAEKRATEMFREIGIRLRMRDGIPSHDPANACGAPIVVQIENAGGYPGRADALAYATPYRQRGNCIHVFLDRVVHLKPQRGFANILLAHVMAHEIGHVLEGVKRHSEEGVMKALWGRGDYLEMERRALGFAPEDAGLIREGVALRGKEAGDFSPAPYIYRSCPPPWLSRRACIWG